MESAKSSSLFPVKIVYVWTMVFIAIVLYAFMWYINSWWIWKVIEAVESTFTFPAPLDSVTDVIKYVLYLHPLFAMAGWLLWGIRNSMKRDVRAYEMY